MLHPWGSDLAMYVEVLNVLGRKNLDGYGWNYYQNVIEQYYHFLRIPILGISWKF
jgi:hypothetical protein